MKSTLAIGALIAAAITFAAELRAQEAASEPTETVSETEVTADTVVARIGDEEFTMGHVLVVRRALPEQYAGLPDDVLLTGIVDQLVDQYLLSTELDEADIPTSLRLRLENERNAMLASNVISSFLAEGFSDEEVQAAYDQAFGDQEPETEYSAAHILVETEEEAQEVIAELEGGADFAELAADRSTGPSGPNGGDLGWFGSGAMVPEFDAAVKELEAGNISAPIKTEFGWHVIKLNETREKPLPELEAVRGQLINELSQTAVADKITGLREAAGVEILLDDIPPDALRNDELLQD